MLLPLAVLVVALVIGSGALDSSPPTAGQRAAALEADVRCPSCTDVSVAESNATTAIAVRHQIESMVAAGQSNADIDQTLVSEYGQTILLVPPDAGGIPLIWIIPIVLGAAALTGVGFSSGVAAATSMRCKPEEAEAVSIDESPRTGRPNGRPRDERWYLTDEREFLRRSLADADREREAGDLSAEDHAVLVARDRARLAEVEGELAALDAAAADAPTARPPSSEGAAGAIRAPTHGAVAQARHCGGVPVDRRRRGHSGRALRPGPPARARPPRAA